MMARGGFYGLKFSRSGRNFRYAAAAVAVLAAVVAQPSVSQAAISQEIWTGSRNNDSNHRWIYRYNTSGAYLGKYETYNDVFFQGSWGTGGARNIDAMVQVGNEVWTKGNSSGYYGWNSGHPYAHMFRYDLKGKYLGAFLLGEDTTCNCSTSNDPARQATQVDAMILIPGPNTPSGQNEVWTAGESATNGGVEEWNFIYRYSTRGVYLGRFKGASTGTQAERYGCGNISRFLIVPTGTASGFPEVWSGGNSAGADFNYIYRHKYDSTYLGRFETAAGQTQTLKDAAGMINAMVIFNGQVWTENEDTATDRRYFYVYSFNGTYVNRFQVNQAVSDTAAPANIGAMLTVNNNLWTEGPSEPSSQDYRFIQSYYFYNGSLYDGGRYSTGGGTTDWSCCGAAYVDEMILVTQNDCNSNNVGDTDEIYGGSTQDCNSNSTPDSCDITSAFSTDCNTNGVPDECDPDCDMDGTPDACDVSPGSCPPALSPQIWTKGTENGWRYIHRYDSNGAFLGTYPTSGNASTNGAADIDAMCIVGSEVWTEGTEESSGEWARIYRYKFDGTYLGTHNTAGNALGGGPSDIDAMIVVGNEVWTGGTGVSPSTNYSQIHRYAFDGNYLGAYNTAGPAPGPGNGTVAGADNIDAMVVVSSSSTPSGGSEVWTGGVNSPGDASYAFIYRYNLSGDYLGRFATAGGQTDTVSYYASQVNTMIRVGNEVWTEGTNGYDDSEWYYRYLHRYSMNGTYLGRRQIPGSESTFGPGSNVDSMIRVGSQVWFGGTRTEQPWCRYIWRMDRTGKNLGFIITGANINNDQPADIDSMLFISEPDCNGDGIGDLTQISGGALTDCNSNFIPDACEISVGTPGGPFYCQSGCATDCNLNGIPDTCEADCNNNDVADECDIAGPTSNDVDGSNIPDECEGSDGVWIGANNGSFTVPTNWAPTGVPSGAGTAEIINTGATDNRCVLSATGTHGIGQLIVGATGSGRQYFRINSGSQVNAGLGSDIQIGGTLELQGGTLSGGPVTNASNSISGWGTISGSVDNSGEITTALLRNLELTGSSFTNQATGKVTASAQSGVLVTAGSVSQAGDIEIRTLGAVGFTSAVTNDAGGLIDLLGGSLSAPSLTNAVGADLNGFGTLDGDLDNDGEVLTRADTQIVGDLVNDGTITIAAGILSIFGSFTNNGTILGDFGGRGSGGGFAVTGDAIIGRDALLRVTGGTVKVSGDLSVAIDESSRFEMSTATVQFSGVGQTQALEVLAEDRGRGVDLHDPAVFAIHRLRVGPGATTVRLTDELTNSVGNAPEAMYVHSLVLEPGTTLDLAGLRLYYNEVTPSDPFAPNSGVIVIDSVGGGVLCGIGVAGQGDVNGDCAVTADDVSLFVSVLVGAESDPARVVGSDVNGDGRANGGDIQMFVNRLVSH